MEEATIQDNDFETNLLQLAKCLTFVQAEKLAVQLSIEQGHISTIRRIYMEDSDMFAYRLLQRWWNACELDEVDAKTRLMEALKHCHLAGLAKTAFSGVMEEPQLDGSQVELSKQYLLSRVENLTHIQVERVGIALGVRPSIIDSLHKMYSDDPQLFGYHVLSHWRNSCELDAHQQREKLELVLPSSTSFQVDYNDDSEVDFIRAKNKSSCTGCRKYWLWIVIFLFLFMSLLISICSIPVLLTVPSFNDYTVGIHSGDTILFPVSQYVTSFNVKLNSKSLCTGKAMALNCKEIQPHFELKNISRLTYTYMAIGSFFKFTFVSTTVASKYESSFVWIFDDYTTYARALDNNFQGYDCSNPAEGNWCYYISTNTNLLPNYVNYTIVRSSYYHVVCFPDNRCPLIKTLQIFQGSYSFNSFDSKPHSYVHLNEEEQVEIVIKSQFDYSKQSRCILAYISNDFETSCTGITALHITDQKHHTGLLLFPGLLIFSMLLFIIVYLMCFCHKLRRSNCSFKTHKSYQILNTFST